LNFDLAIRGGGGEWGQSYYMIQWPLLPSLPPSLPSLLPSLFVFLSQPGFKVKKFGTQ